MKIETTVQNLDFSEDVDQFFMDCVSQASKDDWYKEAMAFMSARVPGSSVYSFRGMMGGLMNHVIGLSIMRSVDSSIVECSISLQERLMAHYEFDENSLPPLLIVREAIALTVRLNAVVADLNRELGTMSVPGGVLQMEADKLSTAEDAYKLSDALTTQILNSF